MASFTQSQPRQPTSLSVSRSDPQASMASSIDRSTIGGFATCAMTCEKPRLPRSMLSFYRPTGSDQSAHLPTPWWNCRRSAMKRITIRWPNSTQPTHCWTSEPPGQRWRDSRAPRHKEDAPSRHCSSSHHDEVRHGDTSLPRQSRSYMHQHAPANPLGLAPLNRGAS